MTTISDQHFNSQLVSEDIPQLMYEEATLDGRWSSLDSMDVFDL